jgi:hypothetical protein
VNEDALRKEPAGVTNSEIIRHAGRQKVFADDEKLTTALLDRLADRATVLRFFPRLIRAWARGEVPATSVKLPTCR